MKKSAKFTNISLLSNVLFFIHSITLLKVHKLLFYMKLIRKKTKTVAFGDVENFELNFNLRKDLKRENRKEQRKRIFYELYIYPLIRCFSWWERISTSTVLIDESNVTDTPNFVFATAMHPLISYSQAKRAYQWYRNGTQESGSVVNIVKFRLTCQNRAIWYILYIRVLYIFQITNTNTRHSHTPYTVTYKHFAHIQSMAGTYDAREPTRSQAQFCFYFTHSPLFSIFTRFCKSGVCTLYTVQPYTYIDKMRMTEQCIHIHGTWR